MSPEMLARKMDALGKANGVREGRAELKRSLRLGRRSVRDVLSQVPEDARTLRLNELLLCLPHHGEVRVTRILARASLSPTKRLGATTERQRKVLAELLSDGGGS